MIKILYGVLITLMVTSQADAQRGCCSRHKGVKGCDEKTGMVICGDGTLSPSCKCQKAQQQKGCCSHHKGVKGCDEKTGMVICGDDSLSPTCKCPIKPESTPVTKRNKSSLATKN
ncbi:MAG TPA: hypothetical protein VNJ29_03925 [Candidatus Nitrosotenuis sp.]|jgi:hypothetical protein|nr:hypothetical protein [Candidatus Nitrosotenuis sp.]